MRVTDPRCPQSQADGRAAATMCRMLRRMCCCARRKSEADEAVEGWEAEMVKLRTSLGSLQAKTTRAYSWRFTMRVGAVMYALWLIAAGGVAFKLYRHILRQWIPHVFLLLVPEVCVVRWLLLRGVTCDPP